MSTANAEKGSTVVTFEFFLKNHKSDISTKLKTGSKNQQNQQKMKFPPMGIKLTTPTTTGLQFLCLTHSANLSFLAFRPKSKFKNLVFNTGLGGRVE